MSTDLAVFAAEQKILTECVKRLVFASRAEGNHLMWGEPADWPHFVEIDPAELQTIDFYIYIYIYIDIYIYIYYIDISAWIYPIYCNQSNW